MTREAADRTIVVGYDGSTAARAAVDRAIDRAIPDGRVVIVYAYHVPADYIAASYYPEMRTDAATLAAGLLDELEHGSRRLAAVAHERVIAVGPAAPAIIRAADVHHADEIIVGSRGVGRARALVGSVAHDVIHRAHCPVTVIPERIVDRGEASAEVVEALA